MTNKRAREINEAAIGLATNIVDDFTEVRTDVEPMPRVMQINAVAAGVAALILKFAQPSKAAK